MATGNDNSTMLDTTLFTDTAEFIKAGVFLEDWFKKDGLIKNKSTKRRKHLQLVLANLLDAHRNGKDSVSYSRNRNDYSPAFRRMKWDKCAERYSPFGASHDPLIGAIDNLSKLDLIDGRKGYREQVFKGAYDGSWSRMYATDKLMDVVEKEFDINLDAIGYSLDNETVILRDQDKNPTDYVDSEDTIQMRKDLRCLNELLNQTRLEIHEISTEDEEGHNDKLDRPYNKFMYRVFNDGSFEKGGRFNGGYWLSPMFPKTLRNRIRINGQQTVLWDFETMSMNLVYNYAGLHCKPGSSPTWWKTGMLREEWPDLQKRHKKLMTFALNTDSPDEWRRVAKGYFTKKRYPKQGPIDDRTLSEFLNKFHGPIKDHMFNKALGKQLMFTESRVTEGIIKVFTDRSIPILPIHDGFICTIEHEELLKDTMVTIYTSVTGKEPSGIHRES